MGSIGMPELLIILVIALVVFGAGKLPQIGKNMGEAIRNFKDATTDRKRIEVIPRNPDATSEERKA